MVEIRRNLMLTSGKSLFFGFLLNCKRATTGRGSFSRFRILEVSRGRPCLAVSWHGKGAPRKLITSGSKGCWSLWSLGELGGWLVAGCLVAPLSTTWFMILERFFRRWDPSKLGRRQSVFDVLMCFSMFSFFTCNRPINQSHLAQEPGNRAVEDLLWTGTCWPAFCFRNVECGRCALGNFRGKWICFGAKLLRFA